MKHLSALLLLVFWMFAGGVSPAAVRADAPVPAPALSERSTGHHLHQDRSASASTERQVSHRLAGEAREAACSMTFCIICPALLPPRPCEVGYSGRPFYRVEDKAKRISSSGPSPLERPPKFVM
ncbi:hypothetical protein [Rhizobium halophilum]|uniref:hypothetical protein n=1 Tax=Rhizobium halophilum TaxID=2846852 RepID=UPI001EFE0F15|nr:hypothetical protein [Rhizobium halophilum]MCF6369746.1 hypothetical protein [Rhizobium halophilum]